MQDQSILQCQSHYNLIMDYRLLLYRNSVKWKNLVGDQNLTIPLYASGILDLKA